MPTVVEVTQFIEANWPHIWWFPNWYLGVPLRFVTGPLVPFVIIAIRRLTSLTLHQSYLLLIVLGWLFGTLGMRALVKEFGGNLRQIRWTTVLFLLWPFHLLLLTYSNGLHHLIIVLLPWFLLTWVKHLKDGNRRNLWLAVVLASVLLLIDVTSLLPLIISIVALVLVYRNTNGWEKGLVEGTLVLLTAMSLSTIWYTPRFWWVLLGNPSFGGKPLSNIIPFVLQLVQALIPLVLGVWVVQKRYRLMNKLTQFGVLFGGSFLFLTLIRFMSDVDFWMDWTGYFLELQLAVAILGVVAIARCIKRWYLLYLVILILTIIDGVVVYTSFKTNTTFKSYKEKITQMIRQQVEPGQRVFLSGSPVFWLGVDYSRVLSWSFPQTASLVQNDPGSLGGYEPGKIGLQQVRGGKDEVSTHPTWAMGAYQIREGKNPDLLKSWLMTLGVSQILLHEKNSQEYFHDFKNLERFGSLTPTTESNGDILYKVEASFARWADPKILQVKTPKEGSDAVALSNYVNSLGEEVKAGYVTPTQIEIELDSFKKDQYLSLAITFDKRWQVKEDGVRLTPDALGNIVVMPEAEINQLTLEYKETWLDTWFGMGISGLCILLLIKAERVTAWIRQKIPSLSSSEVDEEQQY